MAVVSPVLPLPLDTIHYAFTTSQLIHSRQPEISHTPLNDGALGVHKVSDPRNLPHNLVKPPAPIVPSNNNDELPDEAWEAVYPAGSINPSAPIKGGFGFYMSGPQAFKEQVNDKGAQEAVVGYEVMFQEGWEWVKGGKLPGIFGGIGDFAYKCTGGRSNERCKCFNLRLMWRANGVGELYAYLPMNDTNTARLLAVPPFSHQNPDFGFTVGRGAWTFPTGKWTKIAIRARMNDVGSANGEVELWVDGKSVISVDGLVLREDAESHIKGMHFQTFFGGDSLWSSTWWMHSDFPVSPGHSSDWASPKDQRAWFASVSGAVVRR
ncbi:hypothetical protein EVG20_g6115 [Dentipellis fragilis]|uniref:Polysaccharide lyase 14 domain-containing protein n=1 Tax=Dentipellis fragilis TaxID=205917 RepID=A0A4Y9YNG4_9AGAM|nr:hypothetical protein EVG20_g6115 [Dentipellis fragilis]